MKENLALIPFLMLPFLIAVAVVSNIHTGYADTGVCKDLDFDDHCDAYPTVRCTRRDIYNKQPGDICLIQPSF